MSSSRLHLHFESDHPSIYAIFDIFGLIRDQQIIQQIREHIVCIECEYVLLNLIKKTP